ncbi:MAG: ARMT1-like domain-containing protein [Lachnospiraceae bacterium]|nr:ARMT1-like domain-containing protein [Lachnospiraceae bacterium]
MKTDYPGIQKECVECIKNRKLNSYPKGADKAAISDYRDRVNKLLLTLTNESSPEVSKMITDIKAEIFGRENANEYDFEKINTYFNELMLGYEQYIDKCISSSGDPLKAAVKFSMIGNYIDFGAQNTVDEAVLKELIDDNERFPIDKAVLSSFSSNIEKAKSIAYFTDNCGEIVFDKLLIRLMHKLNPNMKLYVIVRGKPVLNDATVKDALQVGLDKEPGVILLDNGNDLAGTCLNRIPEHVLDIINGADFIVSKGQGNYETLQYSELHAFYIFLCKCELFMSYFNVPRLTGIFTELSGED